IQIVENRLVLLTTNLQIQPQGLQVKNAHQVQQNVTVTKEKCAIPLGPNGQEVARVHVAVTRESVMFAPKKKLMTLEKPMKILWKLNVNRLKL
ncbi:MAG: hypothetical protein ACTSYD_01140, partial [Candidatus Heimdallarchaeaceae archaeon]